MKPLRVRIELAIIGRTADRAADAVMAILAEQFTEEQWQAERDDPEAGHTFRIEAHSRGSYAVLGEDGKPGPHTDADWMAETPFVIEVRAWNLSEAMRKAAQLPLPLWRLTPEEPAEAVEVCPYCKQTHDAKVFAEQGCPDREEL